MRFGISRHLGPRVSGAMAPRKRAQSLGAGDLLESFGTSAADAGTPSDLLGDDSPPPEFSWPDYLAFLLYIDAEIEHGLMVQYLYAAYSLGGPQVPPAYRDMIRGWQEVVLGIAKEEMGHLISVQNVLKLIGAPLNFGREDFPWDSEFYPFPFSLEPLTLNSLACFVYAEAPEDWTGPEADQVKERVLHTTENPRHVSTLFHKILDILRNPERIPDDVFSGGTWPYQANWDQWGRGYRGGKRGNTTGANPPAAPDVLVVPVASRDDAIAALTSIAEQGELPPSASTGDPSHFARFLKIFQEMQKLDAVCQREGWSPARKIASNPYIAAGSEPSMSGACAGPKRDALTNDEAIAWAQLFNVRYRLLLTLLIHGYDVSQGSLDASPPNPLATIINATFGEMYNLRAIANILVSTPANDEADGLCAGPPFELPYTLNRPAGEANRWKQHREVLRAASTVIEKLRGFAPRERHEYLDSLRDSDQGLLRVIDAILNGAASKAP